MIRKWMRFAAAFLLVLCAAGCGSNTVSGMLKGNVVTPKDGYAEGKIGDSMRTAWFDFRVNNASLVRSYGDYSPSGDNVLLVVNITLENTYDSDVLMFDTDFQAQWGGEGDDDYRMPITYYEPIFKKDGMLEGEYTLETGKNITGDLVFEVPGGMSSYSLSFMEYYDTQESGDLFFVFFDVK